MSEKACVDDGIVFEDKKKFVEKTQMEVPKRPENQKKKSKGVKRRKWFPNAEGKYQCPYCDKSYKTPASARNHVWVYHQEEKLKTKNEKGKKERKTDPPTIPLSPRLFLPMSVLEWLEVLPSEIIETISPEKLKKLILDNKKEEDKKNVAKN